MTSEARSKTTASVQQAQHTPLPIKVEIVETSCGHCLKIGSEELLAIKRDLRNDLPPFACIYVDYGKFAKEAMSFAARVVKTYNEYDETAAKLAEVTKQRDGLLEVAKAAKAFLESYAANEFGIEGMRLEGKLRAAIANCKAEGSA